MRLQKESTLEKVTLKTQREQIAKSSTKRMFDCETYAILRSSLREIQVKKWKNLDLTLL